jgi:hypothetical protein
MGPESKIMGGLGGFPIDVFEGTRSEGVPITINAFYNITHIVSRDLVFTAEKLALSLSKITVWKQQSIANRTA